MRMDAVCAPIRALLRAPRTRRLRAAAAREDGVSLVEMILVSALGVILMFTVLMFLEQGARSQIRTGARVDALTQQRVGFAFMAGELRQAETFHMVPSNAITSAVVEFDTYVRAGASYSRLRRVKYDCSAASRCTRAEGAAGTNIAAGTTAVPVIDKVTNASFTPQNPPGAPAWTSAQGYPGHVRVTVEVNGNVPGGFAVPLPLEDGVALRNVLPPSS